MKNRCAVHTLYCTRKCKSTVFAKLERERSYFRAFMSSLWWGWQGEQPFRDQVLQGLTSYIKYAESNDHYKLGGVGANLHLFLYQEALCSPKTQKRAALFSCILVQGQAKVELNGALLQRAAEAGRDQDPCFIMPIKQCHQPTESYCGGTLALQKKQTSV